MDHSNTKGGFWRHAVPTHVALNRAPRIARAAATAATDAGGATLSAASSPVQFACAHAISAAAAAAHQKRKGQRHKKTMRVKRATEEGNGASDGCECAQVQPGHGIQR